MPITTALEIVSITNPSLHRKQNLHIAETENPDEVQTSLQWHFQGPDDGYW